jgi:hypothetical protein
MHPTTILAFPVLAMLASCAVPQGKVDEEVVKRAPAAKLAMAGAIAKGVQEAGGGAAYKIEFEIDEGKAVWSIAVARGTKTVEVSLDPDSGKVVEKDDEDEDASAVVAACKLSLADAVAAAGKKGLPIEATLHLADGKPVADIVMLDVAAKTTSLVRIDGVTGRALPAPAHVEATEHGEKGEKGEKGEESEKSEKGKQDEKQWTDVFHETPDEFSATGRSTFMILEPGYKLTFQGKEGSKTADLVVAVLPETKKVGGVETRVVEERESADGKLVEVSRNYFAISKRTSCVFYFGEDVDMYEDGKVKNHEGSWHAGENGARAGIFLPGVALLGARFYQEIAPRVAMDRAEIVSLGETVVTPAGKYERVMKYEETSPLEKGDKEYKWFAPGVGLIQDGTMKLVKIEK